MKIPFFNKAEKREKRSGIGEDSPFLDWLIKALAGGRETKAGVSISEETAMYYVPVYACVRVISETIASLPLPVYKRTTEGKERATEHPLYNLLQYKPNEIMTAFTLKEFISSQVLLWGNGFAEIEFDNYGKPIALWPIPASRVQVLSKNYRSVFYEIALPNGEKQVLPSYRMLHIAGLGFNGLKGFSVISMVKESLGLGMALEQFGAEYFKNGASIGAVVSHPGSLSDSAFARLKKDINEKYTGLGKSHRLMLLEEGMKFEKNTIPPNDSQFLESRKFQKIEVASIFRVPPHMIGDLERSTFSNIEHQSIEFVTHTIRPWLVRWEQCLRWKLFSDDNEFFAEFLVEGLLRGDISTRYSAYAVGRQWGWLSANDVRRLENLNPIGEDGDIYLIPMNMIPADQARLPEPVVSPNDGDRSKKLSEERSSEERSKKAKRQALARFKTTKSFERVFAEAAARVVRREREKVLAEAKKSLAVRSADTFMNWVEDFYSSDFPVYLRKQMSAPIASLTAAVKSLAEQEVDAENIDIDKAVGDYTDAFVARYTKSSKGQLRQIINKSLAEELDMLEEIEGRLSEWDEKRPGKIAMNETVQVSAFIAKTVFAAAGIMRLRWVNTGSETCEFCSQLDGVVVGIDEPFMGAGQEMLGKNGYMSVTGPKFQPPLHKGCQCTIISER